MVRKMLEGQKCLVIGSGISGIGAVALLEKYNAAVVLYDSSDKLTGEDLKAKLPEGSQAVCIAGELPENDATPFDDDGLHPLLTHMGSLPLSVLFPNMDQPEGGRQHHKRDDRLQNITQTHRTHPRACRHWSSSQPAWQALG